MTGRREVFDQAMRLGHSAAWDQQWDRAITAYQAALKEFPDDPDGLTSLGFALLQADRLEQALHCYQRAASLNAGDPIAPEKCGEIFERLGRLSEAAQTYLAVAEVHLKRRDVQKAMANWSRVVRLTPDSLAAHSRLALASERMGQTAQAVREYLEVARIFQRARDIEKAMAAANRALQLDPQSAQAQDALDKLRRGLPLPVPERAEPPSGSPPALSPADLSGLELDDAELSAAGDAVPKSPASPLAAAEMVALGLLAELLFEEETEPGASSSNSLVRGTGALRGDKNRRAQAIKLLGQAINSQSTGDVRAAVNQYESALAAGLDSPVVEFVLGALYLGDRKPAEAVKKFRRAVNHEAVGLGALYGLGQAEHQLGQNQAALGHLLEALRRLDEQHVPPEKQAALDEGYESLAEGFAQSAPGELAPVITGLLQFLSGEGWDERVRQARRQLDSTALDGQVPPLAELLAVSDAGQIVDSLRQIETHMSQKLWATAMEEAYYALSRSPTHLPIHVRMADILAAENKVQAAVDKYAAVAETYRSRGELARAARIAHQILRLSPLDTGTRSWLVEVLVEQGKIADALAQFADLADTYYQLADLDSARNTFADALLLAQQHTAGNEWYVRLLHRMGDIDLQRLNWRDAQTVYEQIRNLAPDDHAARATLIDLLFRLGNTRQALVEVDAYLRHLLGARNLATAISLLEELVESHPAEMSLVARLARLYQDGGRRAEAIGVYDRLGELQLQAGLTAQAAETIRTILALGPADAGAYQQLLEQLQA